MGEEKPDENIDYFANFVVNREKKRKKRIIFTTLFSICFIGLISYYIYSSYIFTKYSVNTSFKALGGFKMNMESLKEKYVNEENLQINNVIHKNGKQDGFLIYETDANTLTINDLFSKVYIVGNRIDDNKQFQDMTDYQPNLKEVIISEGAEVNEIVIMDNLNIEKITINGNENAIINILLYDSYNVKTIDCSRDCKPSIAMKTSLKEKDKESLEEYKESITFLVYHDSMAELYAKSTKCKIEYKD